MANFASRTYKIISVPSPGSESFDQGFSYNTTLEQIYELPALSRTGPQTFTTYLQSITGVTQRLAEALGYDYEPGGLVISLPIEILVVGLGDEIKISAIQYGCEFTAYTPPAWMIISEDIPEVPPAAELEITSITPTTADGVDKCNNVRYDFTIDNDIPADYPIDIISPIEKVCNTVDDLYFDYLRYPVPTAILVIQSAIGNTADLIMPNVDKYDINGVTVIETFTGATATINIEITTIPFAIYSLTTTYSLDDISYQSSNVFYGLTPGSYTAYVLDNYGCKKSTTFEVIGVTVDKPGPVFIIENANPLKFYKSTEFTACGEIPNFDNSPISDQGYWNIEKQNYQQPVNQCDDVITQIKTTYETITINVVDCDNNIVQVPVVSLETENILQKDKRDCQLKSGDTGKTNIYYITGNTYDPGTTDINGSYTLSNGVLPEWASDGNIASGITITLSSTSLNGTFTIEQSVYDEEIQGYALQINAVFTGTPGEAGITEAVYNEEDYNIYEFTIDFASIDEGIYKVYVYGTDTDPRYDDVLWISEEIFNYENHERTVLFRYSNPDNIQQIDYSTGVEFTFRVPARFVKYRNGGESENFVSDDGTKKQLKGVVIMEIQLETSLIPQYMVEKLFIASIHKNLYINGVKATLSEQGESEDLFSERNPFYTYVAWYQFGEPIEISDASGIISTTGRALEVSGNALSISI